MAHGRVDVFFPVGHLVMALGLFALGGVLESRAPGLGTSSWQMLIWGFFISTVALYHATFTINSLDHMWGKRRYETKDCSRNNWMLAILTLGEGWHNNHHHYPVCARQGFFWWELDPTYYLLRLMELCGIIRELRGLPQGVLNRNLVKPAAPS